MKWSLTEIQIEWKMKFLLVLLIFYSSILSISFQEIHPKIKKLERSAKEIEKKETKKKEIKSRSKGRRTRAKGEMEQRKEKERRKLIRKER